MCVYIRVDGAHRIVHQCHIGGYPGFSFPYRIYAELRKVRPSDLTQVKICEKSSQLRTFVHYGPVLLSHQQTRRIGSYCWHG